MVRVRAAEPRDLPRLVEIVSRSVTSAQWNPSEYEKLFAPEQLPIRAALVVEQRDEVAGFIVGRQVENEWEIENVAVTASARRLGLGTRLVGEFLRLVREHGGSQVFLEVRESNHAARALYEKWAFIECGRRKGYYSGPSEDALILRFYFP